MKTDILCLLALLLSLLPASAVVVAEPYRVPEGEFPSVLPPASADEEDALDVPRALQRLGSARSRLFAALTELELRTHDGLPDDEAKALLRELLPHHAAFRREMQLWGQRSLSEERLRRWQQEDLGSLPLESMPYGAAEDWLEYLLRDAEEAEAQYRLLWQRACRHAVASIREHLGASPELRLPAEPAWALGEPAGQGIAAESARFYRLRDAMAFRALSRPVAAQPAEEGACAGQVWKNERRRQQALWESSGVSLAHVVEAQALAELLSRAGISSARLAAPARSGDEGHARVEAEAARMASLLGEAERLLPSLPAAAPDAACRRLLVQLAAQWNAYTYTLERWGRTDRSRLFKWYGGCMGYRPVDIWGDEYYMPGIRLYRVEGETLAEVDRGNARGLLTALVEELRAQLEGSLREHREPSRPQPAVLPPPSVPWEQNLLPEDFTLPNL